MRQHGSSTAALVVPADDVGIAKAVVEPGEESGCHRRIQTTIRLNMLQVYQEQQERTIRQFGSFAFVRKEIAERFLVVGRPNTQVTRQIARRVIGVIRSSE